MLTGAVDDIDRQAGEADQQCEPQQAHYGPAAKLVIQEFLTVPTPHDDYSVAPLHMNNTSDANIFRNSCAIQFGSARGRDENSPSGPVLSGRGQTSPRALRIIGWERKMPPQDAV